MTELDQISRNRWVENGIIKVIVPIFSDDTGRLYAYRNGVLLDDPETGYTHPAVDSIHFVFKLVAVPEGYLDTLVQKLNQEGGE